MLVHYRWIVQRRFWLTLYGLIWNIRLLLGLSPQGSTILRNIFVERLSYEWTIQHYRKLARLEVPPREDVLRHQPKSKVSDKKI